MIKALYLGQVTNVYVNSFKSGPIEILLEVGQGDPISCPFFDISVEGFTLFLYLSELSGVTISSKRITSIMFAYDTFVPSTMDNVEKNATVKKSCLAMYGVVLVSKMNYPKSTVLIIGDKKPNQLLVGQKVRISRSCTTHLRVLVDINILVEIGVFWADI